jgi:rubrerythrin
MEVIFVQLTQKEILQLQDALNHERICVTKYNNYANQLQDQALSNLFKDLANREQQHVNTITQLLQQGGVQPSN